MGSCPIDEMKNQFDYKELFYREVLSRGIRILQAKTKLRALFRNTEAIQLRVDRGTMVKHMLSIVWVHKSQVACIFNLCFYLK